MTINKYQGRTQEEAIRIAKEQLGENAVIMNVRPIKSKGLFHFLKDSAYEVTAAVEEQQPVAKSSGLAIQDNINFSADEEIKIPIQPQETGDEPTGGSLKAREPEPSGRAHRKYSGSA